MRSSALRLSILEFRTKLHVKVLCLFRRVVYCGQICQKLGVGSSGISQLKERTEELIFYVLLFQSK